jgi:hypothetical protein
VNVCWFGFGFQLTIRRKVFDVVDAAADRANVAEFLTEEGGGAGVEVYPMACRNSRLVN